MFQKSSAVSDRNVKRLALANLNVCERLWRSRVALGIQCLHFVCLRDRPEDKDGFEGSGRCVSDQEAHGGWHHQCFERVACVRTTRALQEAAQLFLGCFWDWETDANLIFE
ncbi:unnamed protein product [Nesidiocoris tenuis]|uniref:Uncharacterized protein n=1 Tax=Nesidiocoris tenuis TaxID=355587 RepID=A0A6H5FV40_9HEMI|nr:unnamed protein product [Nesidiocoris tenuis]